MSKEENPWERLSRILESKRDSKVEKKVNRMLERTRLSGSKTVSTGKITLSGVEPLDKSEDMDITNLGPGCYKASLNKDGGHVVKYVSPLKELPPKLYGDVEKLARRYWRAFKKYPGTLTTTAFGEGGTGKTTEGEVLSNIAITEDNMPCIEVNGFTITDDTLNWLYTIDNAVLVFDEYGKNCNMEMQGKMLPFFTDKIRNNVCIIIDNEEDAVSRYFRSRPGRARYRRRYKKMRKKVFQDMLDDTSGLRPEFRTELIRKYASSSTFTIDHLRILLEEHLDYPDETLEEMLEVVNVDLSTASRKWYFNRVWYKEDKSIESTDDFQVKEIKTPPKGYVELPLQSGTISDFMMEFNGMNTSVKIGHPTGEKSETTEKEIAKTSDIEFYTDTVVFVEDGVKRISNGDYILEVRHEEPTLFKFGGIKLSDYESKIEVVNSSPGFRGRMF